MSDVEVECVVLVGGPVGDHKGLNVPDLKVPLPALTDKDSDDALFALHADVDYFALSFVQRAQDVIDLRLLLQSHLQDGRVLPRIIAKIEKPQATHTQHTTPHAHHHHTAHTRTRSRNAATSTGRPLMPNGDSLPCVLCVCRPSRPSTRSWRWWTG